MPAAVSLGGDKDIGGGFDPGIREELIRQVRGSGLPFIYEPNLEKNIETRMKVYLDNAPGGKIAAFINAGGSYANLGTDSLILRVKPGLNREITALPPKSRQGMIFAMAARHIPCIHLLFIKGLVQKYRLPWDPVPLPQPGQLKTAAGRPHLSLFFWLVMFSYFFLLLVLPVVYQYKKTKAAAK